MKYYVYLYLDLDNVPFYVGKGRGDRYLVVKHLTGGADNRFLKNKIRKVGIANTKIHFLHKNLIEKEAFYWERYWIKYIGRRDKGEGTLCNLTDGGEGDSGRIVSKETKRKISKAVKRAWVCRGGHSEESKRKISEAGKGHEVSEETKQKLRGPRKPYGPLSKEHKRKVSEALKGNPKLAYWKGKTLSKEAKQKISEARKGHETSKETKLKISEANKGHTVSKETRQKISKANKGRKLPKETKQKMSKAQKGRKHSVETRQKISKANKGKVRSEEAKQKMSKAHKGKSILKKLNRR